MCVRLVWVILAMCDLGVFACRQLYGRIMGLRYKKFYNQGLLLLPADDKLQVSRHLINFVLETWVL